jgi:hypothetical protein
MLPQHGIKTTRESNPDRMMGIYSGIVESYVRSADKKIIGVNASLELYGPVKNIRLSSEYKGRWGVPQIGEEILVQFIDGRIERPVIMKTLYPYAASSFGSDEKEYFDRMPNGVTISADKSGNVTITLPPNAILKINSPGETQKAARKGDKTTGHKHLAGGSVMSPGDTVAICPFTGSPHITLNVSTETDTIEEGSETVKIGD